MKTTVGAPVDDLRPGLKVKPAKIRKGLKAVNDGRELLSNAELRNKPEDEGRQLSRKRKSRGLRWEKTDSRVLDYRGFKIGELVKNCFLKGEK